MVRQTRQFHAARGRVRWAAALAVALAGALAGRAARADVVAHWCFDATDANGVYPDSAGNAHPATPADRADVKVYDGTPPAPFGKAVTFNGGPGAYLTIPPITTIQKRSFTVASWVIFTDPGPAFVLTDWVSSDKAGFAFGIYPFGTDQTTAQPMANLASTETTGGRGRGASNRRSVAMQRLANKTVPFNEWHHLAWTWDRDGATLTTYMDGNMLEEFKRPQNSQTYSKSLDVAINDQPMLIGSQVLAAGNPSKVRTLKGSLDELWIFDQALTPIQLRNLVKYNDIEGNKTAAVTSNTTVTPISATPVNPAPTPTAATDTGTAPPPDGTADRPAVPLSAASGRLGAGRVAGIVACLSIVVTMACYLIWAVTERGKLRAAGRL